MCAKGNLRGFAGTRVWRLCICAAIFVCGLATAQPTTHLPRIGFIGPRSSRAETAPTPFMRGFLEGMREHGYVEERDYILEFRSTHGDPQRFGPLSTELARLPVDVL